MLLCTPYKWYYPYYGVLRTTGLYTYLQRKGTGAGPYPVQGCRDMKPPVGQSTGLGRRTLLEKSRAVDRVPASPEPHFLQGSTGRSGEDPGSGLYLAVPVRLFVGLHLSKDDDKCRMQRLVATRTEIYSHSISASVVQIPMCGGLR